MTNFSKKVIQRRPIESKPCVKEKVWQQEENVQRNLKIGGDWDLDIEPVQAVAVKWNEPKLRVNFCDGSELTVAGIGCDGKWEESR